MTRVTGLCLTAIVLGLCISQQEVRAHGGVVNEGDLCLIKINYLTAHFKIYQPRTRQHDEYCEDLPDVTESIFVMEYLHDELAKVPIDFRIIRDVTGKGRFARWEDVAAIENLDDVTVFYQEPVIEPDVFTVIHEFDTGGLYIGVVTVKTDTDGGLYIAVFPFEVGYTGIAYWQIFAALMIIIQLQYFVMSGRLARWRAARRQK